MDYNKLKFKAGVEIHQQLETNKLFSNAPSILRDDEHDILISRKLRAVSGEGGEKDIAAEHAEEKNLTYLYQGFSDSVSAVELDEEPPRNVNEDALNVALQICLLLKCSLVDEIQVMRKTVVDGSNTSGFQRTMLLGYNGKIETTQGIVEIDSVCLEEDSARKVKQKDNVIVYRLDRLGIPLIEIATKPNIKNADHAKEVCEKIGMILRSTGKVKRGLGTIRQDVNVSVKGGNRVELKGFQDLRNMPKVIEREIKRQVSLKGKVKKEVRNVNPDGSSTFMRPMPGANRMYPETDVASIQVDKKLLAEVKLPELIDEKILRYEKKGLSSELARSIIKDGINLEDYSYALDINLIAKILVEYPKDIKKRLNLEHDFKDEDFRFVLGALDSNKINKEAAKEVLIDIANGVKINLNKYKPLDLTKVEEDIKELIKKNKGVSIGGLVGIAMGKYKGKVEGKIIASLVAKHSKV